MNTSEIISAAMGILSPIILGALGYLWGRIKGLHKDNASVREGVQAMLRAQMLDDYNHYMDKGFAPVYARDSFENCWKRYHDLGANGVMDDIHKKFMELPTTYQGMGRRATDKKGE
jgi:hypothetical protein